MMKLKLLHAFTLFSLASLAQAHPAIHTSGLLDNLIHFLTQPDHLAMMAGAAAVGYLLVRKLRAGGAK